MYKAYFKLSCAPFENTLDQRFHFMSKCHRDVIAALLYFARDKKGFALVCGDVGTGKTMIVHHFLGKLKPGSVLPVLIPYPNVGYVEILRYLAGVLGINTAEKGALELSDEVKAELVNASAEGKQVVLIIDEAHLLPDVSLENIRLLSNIELSESKLLQILLIGQNELAFKLRKRKLRQLRQRININRVLSPMSLTETIDYIDHRLKVAGSSFNACFEPDCRKPLYQMTGGVPRSINRLCDTALLVCMTQKGDKVTRRILKKAQNALESDSILSPETRHSGSPSHFKKLWPVYAAALALVLFLAMGFFVYSSYFGCRLNSPVHGPEVRKEASTALPEQQVPAVKAKAPATGSPPGTQAGPAPVGPPAGLPGPGKAAALNSARKPSVTSAGNAQTVGNIDSVHGPEVHKEASAALPKLQVPAIKAKAPDNPVSKAPATGSPPGRQAGPGPVGSPAGLPGPGKAAALNSAQKPPVASAGNAQPPGNMDKGAKAGRPISPPGEKVGPAPPEAKERATGHPVQAENPELVEPPEKIVAPANKTLTAAKDHQGREAAKPAPVRSDFIFVTVKKGDSLGRIAAKWFPEDPVSGLKSIVAANPKIHDENFIMVDQILKIPPKN